MSPALDPLTAAMGVLLAGMGAHHLWTAVRARSGAHVSHHGSLRDEAVTYLLVLLPVGLGLLFSPRPLDPSALGSPDAARVVVAFPRPRPWAPSARPSQPIRDVADLFV